MKRFQPIKVRFNLSRGKFYMKWKVVSFGEANYYSPEDVQFIMSKCTLKNRRKTAEKIYQGENKTVCAWIECYGLTIMPKPNNLSVQGKRLRYNPKIQPNWFFEEDGSIINADNKTFDRIETFNNNLFII